MKGHKIKVEIVSTGECGFVATFLTAMWEVAYALFASDFKLGKQYTLKTEDGDDYQSSMQGAKLIKIKVIELEN